MSDGKTENLRVARGGTQVTEGTDGPRLDHRVLRLAIVEGPDRGARFEVASTHVTIGSSPSNDVVLRDEAVSGRHCELRVDGDRVLLRDCGSTNGTELNGVRVAEAELPVGGRIRLGRSELRFQPRRESHRLGASESTGFGELTGRSAAMREVFGLLERVAPTELTVLLTGETGTGKEVAARSIHAAGPRPDAPFVIVDCAAISASLSESELFGHEKGAFTGALRTHVGPFEEARGGTVFLDEVGELPLTLQKKLLRVLEARQVRRVGATEWIDVHYRLVAATHRDLSAMIRAGEFREDLYFRLAEVIVRLPPLRDREGDVLAIAEAMLAAQGAGLSIGEDAKQRLIGSSWPGNVRELRNAIRHAAAFCEDGVIGAAQLPLAEREPGATDAPSPSGAIPAATMAGEPDRPAVEVLSGVTIKEAREHALYPITRAYLAQLLERHGTDLDAAAEEAGLHRKSLLRLLREHDLRPSWLPQRPTND
ncbi:MAG: sigma 54-interacting transcriptional regulator [Sandaracinaceae bacterium]